MAESAASARRRAWARALVYCGSAAGLIVAAGLVMFSTLMYYDDEGYVLISLRNFAEHGRLYRDVYTQYGPFPFVCYAALHALGLPFTHTAGRLLALAAWSGAALASAAIVAQVTRGLAVRLAVLASVFAYLWVMGNEPPHPGGLIALLTAGLAWLGSRWIEAPRPRAWAALVGAGVAALFLTKINIGIFALCSAVAWWLLHHENATLRRWSPALLAAGAVGLPFALMWSLLETPWAFTFAAMFAVSGLMAIGAAGIDATPRTNGRALAMGVAAAGLVALIVVGVVFARGTAPHDLLEGVLLRPIRHPVHFNLRFLWPAATPGLAVAAGILFTTAWTLRRRWRAPVDGAIAGLRLAATLALVVALMRFPAESPDRLVLAFAMPWIWLFLWPLAGEPAGTLAARRWVGLLLLGQCLHAFPVPGSQVAWGTFLAIPLAASGAYAAVQWLRARFDLNARWLRLAPTAAVAALAIGMGLRFTAVAARYRVGSDLDLPGTRWVRPPERTAVVYRALTLNAIVHSDLLFSLPGMFSFNLWTGLPTPTLANVTHWFSLLEEPEQHAIIRALEASPRVGLIVQRDHLDFLAQRGFAPRGPLFDFLVGHYEKAFAVGGFEFWVQRGRTVAPLSTARLFRRPGADDGEFQLNVSVLMPPGTHIARLEWLETADTYPARRRIDLDAHNSRLEITPLRSDGTATGPALPSPWPASPPRLARLGFITDAPLATLARNRAILRLRDDHDNLVAEAVFTD